MKATERLLTDHRMVRKILEGFLPDNPRFPKIAQTLHRALVGHAWFEDAIFLPAFEAEPLLYRKFVIEIEQEHKDINDLLKQLRKAPEKNVKERLAWTLQTHVLVDTHFAKEEDGLFPMAERILDSEGLNQLGDEMEQRKLEIRSVVEACA